MAELDAAELSSVSDQALKELVRKHLHPLRGDPEVWEALFAPDAIERTYEILTGMLDSAESAARKRNVELQAVRIACLDRGRQGTTEWLHADALHQQWKSKNGGFTQLVQRRLSELRKARGRNRHAGKEERAVAHAIVMERDRYRTIIRDLTRAIHLHQARTAAGSRSAEQYDYDLWRLLDGIEMPVGPGSTATLRDVLRTYWFDTSPATVADGERGRAERLMQQAPGGRSAHFEGVPKARRVNEPRNLA